MLTDTATYYRCVCQKCGSNFATVLSDEEALQKEACPSCSEKGLKLAGALSEAEINSLFYSGG